MSFSFWGAFHSAQLLMPPRLTHWPSNISSECGRKDKDSCPAATFVLNFSLLSKSDDVEILVGVQTWKASGSLTDWWTGVGGCFYFFASVSDFHYDPTVSLLFFLLLLLFCVLRPRPRSPRHLVGPGVFAQGSALWNVNTGLCVSQRSPYSLEIRPLQPRERRRRRQRGGRRLRGAVRRVTQSLTKLPRDHSTRRLILLSPPPPLLPLLPKATPSVVERNDTYRFNNFYIFQKQCVILFPHF